MPESKGQHPKVKAGERMAKTCGALVQGQAPGKVTEDASRQKDEGCDAADPMPPSKKARVVGIDHSSFEAKVLCPNTFKVALVPLGPGPAGHAQAVWGDQCMETDLPNELLPVGRLVAADLAASSQASACEDEPPQATSMFQPSTSLQLQDAQPPSPQQEGIPMPRQLTPPEASCPAPPPEATGPESQADNAEVPWSDDHSNPGHPADVGHVASVGHNDPDDVDHVASVGHSAMPENVVGDDVPQACHGCPVASAPALAPQTPLGPRTVGAPTPVTMIMGAWELNAPSPPHDAPSRAASPLREPAPPVQAPEAAAVDHPIVAVVRAKAKAKGKAKAKAKCKAAAGRAMAKAKARGKAKAKARGADVARVIAVYPVSPFGQPLSAPAGIPFRTAFHRIMWYRNSNSVAVRQCSFGKKQIGSAPCTCSKLTAYQKAMDVVHLLEDGTLLQSAVSAALRARCA